jgi:hypothetical protein
MAPPDFSRAAQGLGGLARRAALVSAAVLAACTSYVEPASCTPGSSSCAGISDARFCEYVATAVEGGGCARVGLVTSRQFCVVKAGPCATTTYAVKDSDCTVVEYERLRDGAHASCPPGAPSFVSR